MKKMFLFMVLAFNMFSFSYVRYENFISTKVHKETNGSYMISLPALNYEETKGFVIHKVEFELLFTAPRSDITNMNHYGILYNNHFGLATTDFFITMSLDLKYIFEGNDYREEPG